MGLARIAARDFFFFFALRGSSVLRMESERENVFYCIAPSIHGTQPGDPGCTPYGEHVLFCPT